VLIVSHDAALTEKICERQIEFGMNYAARSMSPDMKP
jgi:hypothetical protein